MKTVFLFSGQGSQYVGMGKELYDNFETFKEIVDLADSRVPFALKQMLFEENEAINETKYAQALIYTMSYGAAKLVDSTVKADAYLGLSLGEYTALAAAEKFNFIDGLDLLVERGRLMQEATNEVESSMLAVIGLKLLEVEEEVKKIDGFCEIANVNTFDQIIIGGDLTALDKFKAQSKAKRLLNLNVSGAFHTSAITSAKENFEQYLDELVIIENDNLVLSNYTGTYHDEALKDNLKMQMTNTVKFCDNVSRLLADGATTFIEFGPKKTLSSFVKSISKHLGYDVKIYHVEDMKSLEKTLGGVNDVEK